MTDCGCNAGKICSIHIDRVMGNLDTAAGRSMNGLKEIRDNSTSLSPGFRNVIEEMAKTDVSNEPLLYPTPGQIDHEILEQLSLFRQKIADLETAKVFHMTCIENLVERLNVLEKNSQFRFAEGFSRGKESVLRTNRSGCSCIINDSDDVISVCGAHEQWQDNLTMKLKAIEQQFLEILSHGCCIPACSKHQGMKGNG